MTSSIPINLAVEDALSEALLQKLLRHSDRYALGATYSRGGQGYLRKMILAFNNAAKGMPYLLLTDLDEQPCASALIQDWLERNKHPNLLFRVAVRQSESWVLADRQSFAGFLGVREYLIPEDVDLLPNPKFTLIEIARRSPRKDIRSDIVPRLGSTSRVGPNYNGRLIDFINSGWDVTSASRASPSLMRALRAIEVFRPVWPQPNG